MEVPVLLRNDVPKRGTVAPDAKVPNARSVELVTPTLYIAPVEAVPSVTFKTNAAPIVSVPAWRMAPQPCGKIVPVEPIPSKVSEYVSCPDTNVNDCATAKFELHKPDIIADSSRIVFNLMVFSLFVFNFSEI
jgi:hypothetical protein